MTSSASGAGSSADPARNDPGPDLHPARPFTGGKAGPAVLDRLHRRHGLVRSSSRTERHARAGRCRAREGQGARRPSSPRSGDGFIEIRTNAIGLVRRRLAAPARPRAERERLRRRRPSASAGASASPSALRRPRPASRARRASASPVAGRPSRPAASRQPVGVAAPRPRPAAASPPSPSPPAPRSAASAAEPGPARRPPVRRSRTGLGPIAEPAVPVDRRRRSSPST